MRPSTAIPLALLLGLSAPHQATAQNVGRQLVRCQQAILRSSAEFVTRRRHALDRCVGKALRCPAALTAGSGTDACLEGVAARCRRALAGLWTAERRLEASGPRCVAPAPSGIGITPEDFLDASGLGFETVGVFCRQTAADAGDPAAASRCERRALACTTDAALLATVPRAAELLARLGIALGSDPACLQATTCGNGVEDDDEECDDGEDNSDTEADACRTDCSEARCGDGVVDSDEDCDDGNDVEGDGCDSDCSLEDGTCGNGILESDEDCDDGNTIDDDGCDSDCTPSLPECGDGVVDEDEECDQGRLNSDRIPGRCRTDCTEPTCDDGVVDVDRGEECDPPGTLLCSDDCTLRFGGNARALTADAAPADLPRCQAALMRAAGKLFDRTRAGTEGCVAAVARCVLDVEERDAEGTRTDRCLAAANRRCAATLVARPRLAAATVSRLEATCHAAGATLDSLLDAATGLGFERLASSCEIAPGKTPGVHDLLSCVASKVQCRADNAVARAMPRAYELLGELDVDPDEDFPCVTDPDELASD